MSKEIPSQNGLVKTGIYENEQREKAGEKGMHQESMEPKV